MADEKKTDPLWYKDAIVYQIHIKSFFDSNADGYGDIQGLIQKLDYIQDLGVDTIWVLPFYPSPLKDDGYDIADYETVNPVYGSEDDFRRLMKEAHRRGLRVITELVINHTSDQHPWFQSARLAPAGSPERDFYVWSDSEEKYKDARIIFTDTERSNWTWDPVAKAYYWHRFFSHQPDLNFDNPAVFEAVTNVMKKWLAMGVDGLRLDAIPYLVEREGTNCENLPETHDILKQMRAVLDASFKNRIFLAEANQWPTQVREYFGDGDECHMAYNFPVMPRMYMAVHMEDRHPITDIMRETPDIPENCQWAMFLRNHDELTLEMVTDYERDYMYRAYAEHPLMRINVGIRRRLAPLMDYSRPKIQLMNSLLLSLPGTPIIYYGDEIGMGDNVYLSDRHGVRTPMQWSPDRNAGFSQAAFEQLYLPPIMDPVTGFQAVNVEKQQLDPSSLLNWMKSIIKLRKRYKVFGRGSIEILNPSNRKIIAYIRKYQDETVLVVANLSRYPQAAELPLPGYAGIAPIEMFGFSAFPAVTEQPYTITLGPYQFYWLLLSKVPENLPTQAPKFQEVAAQSQRWGRSSIRIIDVKAEDPWTDLTSGALKAKFELDVLPSYISRQRWYGGKSHEIKSTRIVDWTRLPIPAEQAGLFIVEVITEDGAKDLYSLYLSIASGYRAKQMIDYRPQHVLADLRRRSESLAVYDALQSDQFCKKLFNLIADAATQPMQSGDLEAERTPMFSRIAATGNQQGGIRRVTSEQSNSSVIYNDQFILKLYRKISPGTNPDYEVVRYLTEEAGFENVPSAGGALSYRKADNIQRYMLALLQKYFVNQGDGWTHTVEEFRRFYERAEMRTYLVPKMVPEGKTLQQLLEADIPMEVNTMLGVYIEEAENLGVRTGQMHSALAAGKPGTAFCADPMSKNEIGQTVQDMREHVDKVFNMLHGRQTKATPELRELIANLMMRKDDVLSAIERLNDFQGKLAKIRCHGDYHLGQVLHVFDDFIILDFEGEPGRSIEERVQKHSALKDVAGIVRSFSYAAYASLFKFTHNRPEDIDKFLPWASAASTWSTVAFLKGYRTATAGQTFLPADADTFFEALVPFVVDKGIYEIAYELNNRPDWLSIPITGVLEYLNTTQPGRTANVR